MKEFNNDYMIATKTPIQVNNYKNILSFFVKYDKIKETNLKERQKMKKVIGLLLVFMMIFAVCGCGASETDIRGEYTGSSADEMPETDILSKEFSLGETSGKTYRNEFIGIGCDLSEDWSFYTDEQIKELNNISIDMMGEDAKEIIENATIVYDMYATDSGGFNNINVNLEKVNPAQLLALDLAESLEEQFPVIEESLSNMGYENLNHEISTIEIDGKAMVAMYLSGQINGVDSYQVCFQKKCNGYLANITLSTFFEDNLSQLASSFYWLD